MDPNLEFDLCVLVNRLRSVLAESGGIELRDLFAAASLAGQRANTSHSFGLGAPNECASLAYRDADAMLDERQKG